MPSSRYQHKANSVGLLENLLFHIALLLYLFAYSTLLVFCLYIILSRFFVFMRCFVVVVVHVCVCVSCAFLAFLFSKERQKEDIVE